MNNLAENPKYNKIRENLLKELNNWRKNIIRDKGVTDEFRNSGWPPTYPTRSLETWENVLKLWEPWVFQKATDKLKHPGKEIEKTQLVKMEK
jgi:hypothetical protein